MGDTPLLDENGNAVRWYTSGSLEIKGSVGIRA